MLAEDLRACSIPIVGVLGNHDFESDQPEKVVEILHQAGVTILDDQATVIEGVGFAGVKGFVGGFGRGELGAFGEQAIKAFVDESSVRLASSKISSALSEPTASWPSSIIPRSPPRWRENRWRSSPSSARRASPTRWIASTM
jgi:hypothetical protein